MAEGKKRGLRGLQDLRTSLESRVRSLPESQAQQVLDAYMTIKKMQLLENQRSSLNKRKRRAEEALNRLLQRIGDTKLKDLIEEGLAASNGSGGDAKPRAERRPQNSRKRPFATVKLRY